MKKSNLYVKITSTILATLMIAAIGLGFTNSISESVITEATSATTYTRTTNSDGLIIRSQDGYIPESTYDRIGLVSPQDMVIDKVVENGKEVEYGYILNNGGNGVKPFITKINLDDLSNDTTKIEKIDLSTLPYISSPLGLWIQTTTVNGITRKEMYIADKTASYKDSEYNYTYSGLVYRVQFNMETDDLMLNQYDIIHEPTVKCPEIDEEACAVDKSECGLCEEGQELMLAPAFGQSTEFNPTKVAVDKAGNIFIASEGTSAGLIELTYSGEFVSFFVVNTVEYNFLYQFIKKYGTQEQLDKLNVSKPEAFYNVFIDNDDLVYSVTKNATPPFNKYSTSGSSILENQVVLPDLSYDLKEVNPTDSYVTDQGLTFISVTNGMIYVYAPDGSLIFYFGTKQSTANTTPDIVGFFKSLEAITVDSKNRIWALDKTGAFLQTFIPTDYSSAIFKAITSFNEHDYETSQEAWEEVLRYDSLSVLANDGLGKAYYYDLDFEKSLEYFATSKNRTLYSNVFWELRNDYLQQNLSTIVIIAAAVIVLLIILNYMFNNIKKLKEFKMKVGKIKNTRVFKDLTVGFRLIKKPNDTFYELKVNRRGSVLGATIYYALAIVAMLLNTYSYALPFQVITVNNMSAGTVLFGTIAVLFVFILCNYLVSAINDGEGTFKDIYKFTGYSLLPMIICLPLAVGISYGLTLNEQVIISFLKALAFWGSGIILVIGILEVHNYTFTQTVKNVVLTLIFMILFAIICMVVFIMVDQIVTLIETIWKEVKLRVGWY